ncbi:MAG: acyl-CoA dehydrogenase family protein [Acidimicrobiales bacterium]
MSRPLSPVSDAGRRAMALVGPLLPELASRAAANDRAAVFPVAQARRLQAVGVAALTAPTELGGGGVDQLRDVMALAARVAAADASMGIALNMHLSFCWSLARLARAGLPASPAAAELLGAVSAGRVWFCSAVTEAGVNYLHPRTTLTARGADAGGGFRLDGVKVFATASPAATHFNVNARGVGAGVEGRLCTVVVPADAAGVTVLDDWDGMGMRASGSGSVRFDAVAVAAPPDALVSPGGPVGAWSPGVLCGRAFGNTGNLAAMLGVAEAAHELAHERVRRGARVTAAPLGERAGVRHLAAELTVELAAARAALARLGEEADEVAAAPPTELADAHRFMASFQETKLIVNRAAQAVCDRALTLAGGVGYTGASAAQRHYRDVRAGGFMQPFSPHEALGYLGDLAAGRAPDVLA